MKSMSTGGQTQDTTQHDNTMRKYEIEHLNSYSDEEILADIRGVCRALGKSTILLSEYLRNGKFGRKAIQNHFGHFHKALKKLGLDVKRTGYYSDEEIIEDVLAVKRQLGVDLLTGQDYFKHGKYGKKAIEKHFGTWGKLADKLGMKKAAVHIHHSSEQLFGMMKVLWDEKGRQPSMAEFLRRSGHTQKYILRRFKSWTEFLHRFLAYANNDGNSFPTVVSAIPAIGPRDIPAKLRYEVLKRDNSTCVICGAKPPKVVLHIDHIVPYSKGGKTELSNLRTLCSKCNLGKGNRN